MNKSVDGASHQSDALTKYRLTRISPYLDASPSEYRTFSFVKKEGMKLKNVRFTLQELVKNKSKFDDSIIVNTEYWKYSDFSLYDVIALSNLDVLVTKSNGSIVTTENNFVNSIANLMGSSKKTAKRFLTTMIESEWIIIVEDSNATEQGFIRYTTNLIASCMWEYLVSNPDVELEHWMEPYLDFTLDEAYDMLQSLENRRG